MSNNALISEMLQFHFGQKIFCLNGQNGTLTQLVFDAAAKRLTSLTIKPGNIFSKAVSVPVARVEKASVDGLWLNMTIAELLASARGESSGVALDSHTAVKGSTGNGTLTLVATQPESGVLAYIVAHHLVAGHETLLQEYSIGALAPGQISVSADEQLLRALPPYRSDQELQQEVEQIIFDLPFLHIDIKGLHTHVRDGVLHLEGNISSNLRGELVGDQVTGIQGLLGIQNHLIGDDTLAADIAQALGQDERTHKQPIGVYPQLGVVRLSGSVANEQQKAAAREIALSFAGVRDVLTDSLLIDPQAAMLYVMSAPEGGETRDIVPGKYTRHTQ